MKKLIVSFLEAIIFYVILIIPLEYLLTEKFLLIGSVSSRVKTTTFLLIFLVFLNLNYLKNLIVKKGHWFLLSILFFLSILIWKKYNQYYQYLQNFPKIYKISSNWGIQGMEIIIYGKNFGPEWLPGEVRIDDFNFVIKYWSPQKIIVEQPVPKKFFKGKLYVQTNNGLKSNLIDYEVLDPKNLTQTR